MTSSALPGQHGTLWSIAGDCCVSLNHAQVVPSPRLPHYHNSAAYSQPARELIRF
jgi:hypothetical protein